MPDEEAFCVLVRLMKSYDLRSHYTPNMPGLQLRLFQFDRLVEELLPGLHMHLARQGIKSSMYASQWFLTLFGSVLFLARSFCKKLMRGTQVPISARTRLLGLRPRLCRRSRSRLSLQRRHPQAQRVQVVPTRIRAPPRVPQERPL